MGWKLVNPSYAGSTQIYGGDDIAKISNLFSGVPDVDTVDINSNWTFRTGRLFFRNITNTFNVQLLIPATAADYTLSVPLITANDVLATIGAGQTYTGNNTFNGTTTFGGNVVFNATTTIVGSQIFGDDDLQIQNPAGTFKYIFSTSAIIADRIITIPLMTAAGSMVITGNDNDFGAGTNQIFRDGTIRLQPPAASPYYTLSYGTGPAANRTISIPVLTASANFVFDSFANTFTDTNTFSKTAQSGVAEIVSIFKVSDDAVGQFSVENGSAGNALYLPLLRGRIGNTTGTALFFIGDVDPAGDTGTSPMIIFDARRNPVAAITTRPLFTFRNNGTIALQINANREIDVSPTWGAALILNNNIPIYLKLSGGANKQGIKVDPSDNLIIGDTTGSGSFFLYTGAATAALQITNTNQATFTKMAQAGVAETLFKFTVSDATSAYVQIMNLQATDAIFVPKLQFYNAGAGSGQPAVVYTHMSTPTDDAGSTGVAKFDSRRDDNTAIQTRPLFDFLNANVSVFSINPFGRFILTHTDEGSTETLVNITCSDNTTSYLRISNNLGGVLNDFSPIIAGHRSTTNNTYSGLYIQGSIDVTADTNANAVITVDSRAGAATQLTTRALIVFRNSATNVFTINANGNVTENIIAGIGNFESLHRWQVSDDINSYLELTNGSNVDAKFYPLLQAVSSSNSVAGDPVMYFRNFVQVANDTGIVPIVLMDMRRTGSATVITRPLFDFRNNGVSVFRINANGDVIDTTMAQSGITEPLHKWGVSDNAGFILLTNNTATDGAFGGQLDVTLAAGSLSGTVGMIYVARILAANDSGSNPIVQFQAKTTVFGDITVRPLYSFVNNATEVFKISAKGDTLNTIIATTGVTEVLAKWIVNDDATSFVDLLNITSTDAVFGARWRNRYGGANVAISAFTWEGQIDVGSDSGTTPIGVFLVQTTLGVAIGTRPIFDFRNAGTSVFKIGAKGDITNTAIATTGVAEDIETFTVSDNAGSYLKIRNSVATDAMFVPRLVCNVTSAVGAANRAMYYQHYIASTMDSGTAAVVAWDARLSNDTIVVVRPLFEFYNLNAMMLQINPTNFNFNNYPLRNVKEVVTTGELKKTGSVHAGAPWQASLIYGDGLYAVNSVTAATITSDVDSTGGYTRITAATGIDALAEIKAGQKIGRRNNNTLWRTSITFDSIIDVRFKAGFSTQPSPVAGTTCLPAGQSGVVFRYFAGTDTNIQLVSSDASAESAPIDTGFLPVVSTTYVFELSLNATDIDWAIYNSTGLTVLASGSLTTNLPLVTQSMYEFTRTENILATAKSWYFRSRVIYRDS